MRAKVTYVKHKDEGLSKLYVKVGDILLSETVVVENQRNVEVLITNHTGHKIKTHSFKQLKYECCEVSNLTTSVYELDYDLELSASILLYACDGGVDIRVLEVEEQVRDSEWIVDVDDKEGLERVLSNAFGKQIEIFSHSLEERHSTPLGDLLMLMCYYGVEGY